MRVHPRPSYDRRQDPNMIEGNDGAHQCSNLIGMDDDDRTIAICFGVFADKTSGIVCNDLTGSFPFVWLDGSKCFFVLYHYKSNCILANPIFGMDDKTIFEAYKKYFNNLTTKGFAPKLNIKDNQATKHIKHVLSKNECKMQLIEPPHNHRVSAAECAIQTFKDAFIAALATTDIDFPHNCGINLHRRYKPASITCNHKHRCIVTTPLRWVLQTTP